MRRISLSKGYEALVSDEDFARVSALSWYASPRKGRVYARAYIRGSGRKGHQAVYLHRFILDAKPGQEVDHINGDGLDCRRLNIRLCSLEENHRNRVKGHGVSRYKGVSPRDGKWRAYITVGKSFKELGRYASEYEAARAYDKAAVAWFGAFARTNFPIEEYASVVGPIPACNLILARKGKVTEVGWLTKRDAEEFQRYLLRALEMSK